jgi:hypothetical protein
MSSTPSGDEIRKQLIEFLKENLSLDVDVKRERVFVYGEGVQTQTMLHIQLKISDEVISSSTVDIEDVPSYTEKRAY